MTILYVYIYIYKYVYVLGTYIVFFIYYDVWKSEKDIPLSQPISVLPTSHLVLFSTIKLAASHPQGSWEGWVVTPASCDSMLGAPNRDLWNFHDGFCWFWVVTKSYTTEGGKK